jgi:protein O-mannosyl-transferase
VLLAVLVVAVYGPVLRADFVNWDDPYDVYWNSRVTASDWFGRSWTDGRMPGFYPVLYTIYRVEWLAADHRPWLFHLDNVLLHAGNATLVGALGNALAVPPLTGWLAAALWALHPVHVESVAWITERKNILYTFFWLSALLLYVRRGQRRGAYVGALLLFVLALLSKGAALTLPAGCALIEWARGRPLDRRFWFGLLPFIALGIAAGVGLMGLVPANVAVPPLAERLGVACRAFWFYVATFLWPFPLVPIYPTRWALDPTSPSTLLAALGVIVLGVVAVAGRRRLPPSLLVGAGLFVTNIALVLGVVWNSYLGIAFVADRYLYLPGVGLALVAAMGLAELGRAAGLSPRVAGAVLGVWCAVLGVLTWRQVPVWRDSEALWTYTLAHNPDCRPAHENLGQLLADRGDLAGAATHYEAALRLDARPEGAAGLCSVRLRQGRVDEAASLCELGLRLAPSSPNAHRMLAVVRVHQRRFPEAVTHYETALRLALAGAGIISDLAVMINDLAGVQLAQGRVDEAVHTLETGMVHLPDAAVLPTSLAWIRATSTDVAWRDGGAAVRLAERACALTANRDVDALDALAASYAEDGRFADAVRTARQALGATDPGSRRAAQLRARLALYEARQPYRE